MPDISPNDQFQEVLSIAEAQFRKRKITVRFDPWGKMRFVIDEPSLNEALRAASIDEQTFRTIFGSEIGPLLEGTIRGAIEEYVQSLTARYVSREQREPRASLMATLRERASRVERSLATPELRGRYLIKSSSKRPRLRASEWEVVRKTALSTKEPWLQPYATIAFETVLPPEGPWVGSGWLSLFSSEPSGQTDFCTFDCDEEDLDDLIERLKEAKAALHKTQAVPNL